MRKLVLLLVVAGLSAGGCQKNPNSTETPPATNAMPTAAPPMTTNAAPAMAPKTNGPANKP